MNDQPSNQDNLLLITQVRRWRTAFFGLVILLAGILIGWAGTVIWQGRSRANGPPQIRPAGAGPAEVTVQRLRRTLGLSARQVQAIRPIIREHMANINQIRQETRPKVAEQLRLMAQRVAGQLDQQQRQRWNRQFKRLQEQLQWQWPAERPRVQPQRPAPPTTQGMQQRPTESRSVRPRPPDQEPNIPRHQRIDRPNEPAGPAM